MIADREQGSGMNLEPVGFVRNEIREPIPILANGEPRPEWIRKVRAYHRKIEKAVSVLEIHAAYAELLDGIEEFSHVLVLYWPHLLPPERRGLRRIHPMGRKDLPLKGVFATCSPARPNPILVSAVRLLERNGNRVRVQGLEALDGSPIVDLKPYVAGYYRVETPLVPEWMQRIHRDLEGNGAGEA